MGLRVENICVSFGDKDVVRDVSCAADSGKVTALIGPNGAGKSTLLSALAGIVAKTGTVAVDGTSVDQLSAKQRAKKVAFVPQDTALTIGFSVRDVVMLGRYPHRGRWEPETQADKEAVAHALDAVGASHLAERAVNELSGGQRQLVHIARALAQDTPVLLLDEPVSALDLKHQVRVLALLRELAREGKTVVVVLHDLNFVGRWCDEAVLLDNGRIHSLGSSRSVLTAETIEAVYHVPVAVDISSRTGSPLITPEPDWKEIS